MSNRSLKKSSAPININLPENVNQYREEAERIENDPAAMLALVDLIFGFEESRFPPS